jgi:alkyl sulfatase BDS1-like metallo-beta-lactamase superfamily hydrolase
MPPDFADRTDFENADRGLIAELEPGVVTAADGHVVWDIDAFRFLDGECPDTVNASLWRQSQLTARQGLYEVTPGIYQLRGLDLSNMTMVESDNGVIVIDPMVSQECAAAGLALYRQHRGNRDVTTVIYTHPHIDHFGGVLGIVPADTTVPVVAPQGFLEHAVSENVYAGTAMLRRGAYHTGATLPVGPTGLVGVGLGPSTSVGTVGLIAPTFEVTETGQEEKFDGVRIRFQMTPGTEAPAEMNFLFPDHRALCMAENATHNLHNILTLRGAQVRDARIWSRYLAEAIELFADDADVAFASHHWPTWERGNIVRFLTEQRDLYAYIHDQTLRMLNQGYVGAEIAERIEMPPALDAAWHTHGYYGAVNHDVKAIYQRYLGWYDGNPAHLWQHPPEETAQRYTEILGGADAVLAKAKEYADKGDLRFAAELANHAVFAAPDNAEAKQLLASVFERLGHGAECATWRNNYLAGAAELRSGGPLPTVVAAAAGMAPAMTVTQLFDTIAIRIDGPRAWSEDLKINWYVTDDDGGTRYRMELSNGALVHHPTKLRASADLSLTLTRAQLLGVLTGGSLDGIDTDGDASVLARLVALTEQPDPNFAIVTP